MALRRNNLPQSVTPVVTWIEKEPADILSALDSLNESPRQFATYEYDGEGVDAYIRWARSESEYSISSTIEDDKRRHATNAVLHAKRALDCLVNAYLRRDWLTLKLRARSNFNEKLELLQKRPGLRVPITLIPAIISNPRNSAEHEFVTPTVEDSRLAVEAAETVFDSLRGQSDPLAGPAFLGKLTGGSFTDESGIYRYFTGFAGPFAFVWQGRDNVVRVGVGTIQDLVTAEVIWASLEQFDLDQHLEMLRFWNSNAGSGWESKPVAYLREELLLAGLDCP